MVTKFSSQMSDYTRPNFHFGDQCRPRLHS